MKRATMALAAALLLTGCGGDEPAAPEMSQLEQSQLQLECAVIAAYDRGYSTDLQLADKGCPPLR